MSEFLDAARAFLSRRPELASLSAAKLHTTLRKEGVRITKRQTEQLLREEAPEEVAIAETHRVRRLRRNRKYYRVTAVPYSFQADIVKLEGYKRKNKGADGFLLIVEILSRKAWAYPLKGNAMEGVLAQFKNFVADLAPIAPAFVQADDEFAARLFKQYSKSKGFVLRTNVAADDHRMPGGGDALGVLDRFVRTLRGALTDRMLREKTTEWTRLLPGVLDAYNSTSHAAHKAAGDLSPDDVFNDFDELMAKRIEDLMFNRELADESAARPSTLKVGDWVRIIQTKGKFEKGRARLGVERYKIVAARGPARFVLEGADGERLSRSYKSVELTRTQAPKGDAANAAQPDVVAEAQREHTNAVRFKRASRLPQEPAEPAALAAPRQTRLATGAIAKRTWARRDVG